MKAVYFKQPGDHTALEFGDFSTPEPQPGEARVQVKACALNRMDLWLRSQPLDIEMPHIPGSDISGVVDLVSGNSDFQSGDEVVVNPAIPCGMCRRCLANLSCEIVKIIGYETQGGYAEYVVVPVQQLQRKPKSISFVEAAAFPLTFLTAWHMLAGRARLAKGETVFIWGGSGGLGSAGIQIARYLGARVIAAAKSEDAAQRIRLMGADEVLIYAQGGIADRVRQLADGGVDVVFESVGAATWQSSLAMLRPNGRVVIAGTTSGEMASQDLSDIFYYQWSILGARMGTEAEFAEVVRLVGLGALKPVIDITAPLKNAAEAQQRLEAGEHFGKIVLEP